MPSSKEKSVSSDKLQAKRVSQALVEIHAFLQSVARTQDFFTGYALPDAIQERLDLIGDDETTQAPDGSPTLLAELDILESVAKSAIAAAREVNEVHFDDKKKASEDPEEIDNTAVYLGVA